MKAREWFSCILFVAGALAFYTPRDARSHQPASGRDCSAYVYAPPFPSAPGGYVPRYHTVAHTFLDLEKRIGPVTDSQYLILDSLLDEARSVLKPIPRGIDNAAMQLFAVDSLKTIDCILVRHGFVYPGIGLVNLLSDGLDPTMYTDAKYYNALINSPHNAGRNTFIDQRKPGPYYVVDCDTASYLYLAIAEVMNYPVAMVQMPLHNFVRWQLSNGYIDFETMDGKQTSDAYYQTLWGIPAGFVGTPGVLTTMTNAQLRAYQYFGMALAYAWKSDIDSAIATYRESIAIDSSLGDSANNLGWLYAVVPDHALRDGKKAVAFAKQAVAILANGDSLDTLACAYGVAGNFSKAVATQKRAITVSWSPQGSNLTGDLAALSNGRTCEDPGFGADPHPFRQNSVVPLQILRKSANALH